MLEYLTTLGVLTGIFAIAAVGLNITLGYAGVFSTAQAVFVGIGAYATALVGPDVDGSLVVCLALGIGASVVVALTLAAIAIRVSDEYFIVASLAFQIVISTVFTSWYSLTRGTDGISGIVYPRVFGVELTTVGAQAGLVWAVVALVVSATAVLRRGPVGRLFVAIREDPVATQVMGRSPNSGKSFAIVFGAAVSATGGVLYAFHIGFINSSAFDYTLSIQLTAIVIVGGIGWSIGPVIGSAIVVAAIPLISLLNLPTATVGPLEQLAYGALIIAAVVARGHLAAIRQWRDRALRRTDSSAPAVRLSRSAVSS